MAIPFPNHPNLVEGYAPIQMECDAPDLIVEGEIPRDLYGTFYRNGPNPQFAPRGDHHWFGGDGMIHAFHIENGKVAYRNRWVRTKKWLLEHDAGKSLFSAFNPMDTDPSVQGFQTDGTGNTNISWHGHKLLALEEAHAPIELDPVTLETRGAWTFDESLSGPMTAHPKVDPETGEMIFFGYSVDGMLSNKMSVHIADKDGKLVSSQFFDAPYASMVHDFMVTKDFILFPIMPLTGSIDRATQGLPPFAWEPEKGNQIGVMPRGGKVDDIRWFQNDASFVFHPMNAYNQGDVITCDVAEYGQAPLFPNPDGSKGDPGKMWAKLNRWTIDLGNNSDDYKVESLDYAASEFGRLDERYVCHDYRYGYMLRQDVGDNSVNFSNIAMIDHQTGKTDSYAMGDEMTSGEAIFVPKSDSAAEGEGFLLANVYDRRNDKSHLVILDAQNPSVGPLARVFLDHRVPFGFHGNWRSGAVAAG